MSDQARAEVTASRSTVVTGLAGVLGGATLMFPVPDPDQPGFLAFNTCNVIAFGLLMITVVGLWRLDVLGRSRIGLIGIVMTLIALLGFAVVEFLTRSQPTIGELAHPILVPMLAIGMTAVGIVVLRVAIWTGWERLTPLLCGAAPLAIELPIIVLFGPIGWVIALLWVTWVMLGCAQLSTAIGSMRRAAPARTPARYQARRNDE